MKLLKGLKMKKEKMEGKIPAFICHKELQIELENINKITGIPKATIVRNAVEKEINYLKGKHKNERK